MILEFFIILSYLGYISIGMAFALEDLKFENVMSSTQHTIATNTNVIS
jgi:hypothetical protein